MAACEVGLEVHSGSVEVIGTHAGVHVWQS